MGERINLDADWYQLCESVQEILNRNDDLPNNRQGVIDLASLDLTSFINIVNVFGERFGFNHQVRSWIIENVSRMFMALVCLPVAVGDDQSMERYFKGMLDYAYYQFRFVQINQANWFLSQADEYRREMAARGAEEEA